jgi:hypothetical protein
MTKMLVHVVDIPCYLSICTKCQQQNNIRPKTRRAPLCFLRKYEVPSLRLFSFFFISRALLLENANMLIWDALVDQLF